jgi:hypothetical protein
MGFKAARQIDFPSRKKSMNTKKKNRKESNPTKNKINKEKTLKYKKIKKNRSYKNQEYYIYSTPKFRCGKHMFSVYDDFDAYNRQFMGKLEFTKSLDDEWNDYNDYYYDTIYSDTMPFGCRNYEDEDDEIETNNKYNLLKHPYKRHNSLEYMNECGGSCDKCGTPCVN